MNEESRTVFILGGSAEIGYALAERYLATGCRVAVTYRRRDGIADLIGTPHLAAFELDVMEPNSVTRMVSQFSALGWRWDQFLSSVGTMEPIGPFFDVDFDQWQQSIIINALGQLRVLHALFPHRRISGNNGVMFFAGGGTNNPFTNYSAYAASKIFLIKMAELLDDETGDLNVFVVGPGFVRTGIHQETLKAAQRAGKNLQKTLDFLKQDGTSLDVIFECIEWCFEQDRKATGGRNFSTVHDPWRDDSAGFVSELLSDTDVCKLRRRPPRSLAPSTNVTA
jgi:NAD(P)-dependent dehydrogenase (short-subunit alcohol dehydrogenase family)